MIFSSLTLAAGLTLLLLAGDALARGAVALAERLGVSLLAIGLTVVAFGTSAPELFVSLRAAFTDAPGIAVGNVVGSNVANVLLVLGAPALVSPVVCREEGIGFSLFVMALLTATAMAMFATGDLGRLDGLALMAILGGFLAWQFVRDRSDDPLNTDEAVGSRPHGGPAIAAFVFFGIVGLPAGAWLTVGGAVDIAVLFGVSDEVIGLSVIAVGTSLPELVTALMAAWRRSGAVVIGNVVGSNIFNIGAILGITSLAHPLVVAPEIARIDMWAMAMAAALVIVLALLPRPLGRVGGAVMLVLFAAYLVAIFQTGPV